MLAAIPVPPFAPSPTMAQMATVYRLKTAPPAIVGFLTEKLKTPLIQELVQYYSTPLPEDHGVASCIRHDEVKKLAQQMATHTFCCFVKIGAPTLRSTAASETLCCAVGPFVG